MSKQYETEPTAQLVVATPLALAARRLRERGMVTIEYAVGAVMVIALIGVVIAAINQGWFTVMVKDFATFIFDQIKTAMGLKV